MRSRSRYTLLFKTLCTEAIRGETQINLRQVFVRKLKVQAKSGGGGVSSKSIGMRGAVTPSLFYFYDRFLT